MTVRDTGLEHRTLGDCFIVYAATEPQKISSFLVEKGMSGFSLGQKWKDKLGMRASFTSELVFEDVPVPVTNRMGEEGEGTRSWDITKLLGPRKWTYYYLYVILDVISRFVVGWMVALRESAMLAQHLIAQTYRREGIMPGQLTLHADRGSSMASKPVALLLSDLGVTKTHSRPHVSNDNPFSESQFKTLKYRPAFPDRFGSPEHARSLSRDLLHWYNHEHHHSGLGFLTPADVHHGRAFERIAARGRVLETAYARHPERFVGGVPQSGPAPTAVWINKPAQAEKEVWMPAAAH